MLKRFLRHRSTLAAFAWLLGVYLWFALRTTRWTLQGAEHLAPHAAGAPAIAAFWHERLPLMSMLWLMARGGRRWRGHDGMQWTGRPGQRLHVLVSLHRDGRFIRQVVRRFRIAVVLGSSSRGGPAAVRGLLRVLADGDHVVITPDGPRGPRRVAAPGVAQLAALSGVPVLPCAAQTSRRFVLDSWDRMVIPRPFGRGVVVCLPSITVDRTAWRTALPAIEAAMHRAADLADAACPA